MKTTLITLSIVALLFSCKKDYLTKEDLQEELANQDNAGEEQLANWESFENKAWLRDSIQNLDNAFSIFSNGQLQFSTQIANFQWRNNHHEIFVYFDSLSFSKSPNQIISDTEDNYLRELLIKGVENDIIEVLRVVPNDEVYLYSKTLNKFMKLVYFGS